MYKYFFFYIKGSSKYTLFFVDTRQFPDSVTSFLDGSVIYGSSKEAQNSLRNNKNMGKVKLNLPEMAHDWIYENILFLFCVNTDGAAQLNAPDNCLFRKIAQFTYFAV